MLAEREGLTRTILEAFKSPTLYGGKVGTRRSLRPRPQELGYIFSMGYKIYVERNALRLWIWDLKRQGKVHLMLFRYDGYRNRSGGASIGDAHPLCFIGPSRSADLPAVNATAGRSRGRCVVLSRPKPLAPFGPLINDVEGKGRQLALTKTFDTNRVVPRRLLPADVQPKPPRLEGDVNFIEPGIFSDELYELLKGGFVAGLFNPSGLAQSDWGCRSVYRVSPPIPLHVRLQRETLPWDASPWPHPVPAAERSRRGTRCSRPGPAGCVRLRPIAGGLH